MARPFQTDAMKGNMGESLARRPSISIGASPALANGQFEGRRKLAGACLIDIDRIVPDPNQPRTEWDDEMASAELERQADSLRDRGQLQPIRVRWVEELGYYMVVVGERRLRAAQKAGLLSLECVVVQGEATPEDILEDQLVENAVRLDNLPVEQARAYRRLMDARGYSHRDLASRLNIDHAAITRSLALLTLPTPIQEAVNAGEIRPQTAYELSKVEDPGEQAELAEEAKAGRLRRDDIRGRVASGKQKGTSDKGRGPKGKPKLPDERILKTSHGLKVVVSARKGFDLLVLLAALEESVMKVRGEIAASGRGNSSDADDAAA